MCFLFLSRREPCEYLEWSTDTPDREDVLVGFGYPLTFTPTRYHH
uniref:Uncharacterized protein n=1 Tax=Anguilla anguilla TaxID=7936 RepID=A0A0E9UVU5_ANGAN